MSKRRLQPHAQSAACASASASETSLVLAIEHATTTASTMDESKDEPVVLVVGAGVSAVDAGHDQGQDQEHDNQRSSKRIRAVDMEHAEFPPDSMWWPPPIPLSIGYEDGEWEAVLIEHARACQACIRGCTHFLKTHPNGGRLITRDLLGKVRDTLSKHFLRWSTTLLGDDAMADLLMVVQAYLWVASKPAIRPQTTAERPTDIAGLVKLLKQLARDWVARNVSMDRVRTLWNQCAVMLVYTTSGNTDKLRSVLMQQFDWDKDARDQLDQTHRAKLQALGLHGDAPIPPELQHQFDEIATMVVQERVDSVIRDFPIWVTRVFGMIGVERMWCEQFPIASEVTRPWPVVSVCEWIEARTTVEPSEKLRNNLRDLLTVHALPSGAWVHGQRTSARANGGQMTKEPMQPILLLQDEIGYDDAKVVQDAGINLKFDEIAESAIAVLQGKDGAGSDMPQYFDLMVLVLFHFELMQMFHVEFLSRFVVLSHQWGNARKLLQKALRKHDRTYPVILSTGEGWFVIHRRKRSICKDVLQALSLWSTFMVQDEHIHGRMPNNVDISSFLHKFIASK